MLKKILALCLLVSLGSVAQAYEALDPSSTWNIQIAEPGSGRMLLEPNLPSRDSSMFINIADVANAISQNIGGVGNPVVVTGTITTVISGSSDITGNVSIRLHEDTAALPVTGTNTVLQAPGETWTVTGSSTVYQDPAGLWQTIYGVNALLGTDLSTENFGPAVSGNISANAARLFSFSAFNDASTDQWLMFFTNTDTLYPAALKRIYLIPAEDQIVLGKEEFGPNGLYFSPALTWGVSTTANAFTSGDGQDTKIQAIYAQ